MSEPKLCINCVHYLRPSVPPYDSCSHHDNLVRDLVTGRYKAKADPRHLRGRDSMCGPSGAWFEPKPQRKPREWKVFLRWLGGY